MADRSTKDRALALIRLQARRLCTFRIIVTVLFVELIALFFLHVGWSPLQSLGLAAAIGTVYLARDELIGRRVALKVVHSEEGQREQILLEARLVGKLAHSNIVTLHRVHPPRDGGDWGFPDTPFMTLGFRLAFRHLCCESDTSGQPPELP